VKCPGKSERNFIVWREEKHCLLEGSQASPVRPPDKVRVKVNALRWLEAVACDSSRGILNSE
jgi:hypothetical protein